MSDEQKKQYPSQSMAKRMAFQNPFKVAQDVVKFERQIEELTKALEFYAANSTYLVYRVPDGMSLYPIFLDSGKIAKEALGKINEDRK